MKTRAQKLQDRINKIRCEHPRKLLETGYSDAYWDGSFGPMRKYEIWDDPAEKLVEEEIKKEFQYYDRRKATVKAIFNED